MSAEKRKDSKGRILRTGEMQRNNGMYMYSYKDIMTGKRKHVYSWKLERHDKMPVGKAPDLSLREKIHEIHRAQMNGVVPNGANLTVLELVEKYIETKNGVRPTTMNGYRTVISFLKKDDFGKRRIDTVKVLDAKEWLLGLQKDGRSYSSIHCFRGVIRPAFRLAVESDYIMKNPFDFELQNVLFNDSIKREALDPKVERAFLEFVRNDEYFSKYYDGMFILFKTGLRISEFCGLTLNDVDMKERTIDVNHQLQTTGHKGKYIEETKTEAGKRVLPMTDDVYEAFERVIKNRKAPKVEQIIDGYSGFIFLDDRCLAMVSYQWEKRFKHAVEKHNKIYKAQLPKITPHVCRHTYCTNMAKRMISPKTLQYLMGHSSVEITLNVYTHYKLNDAKKEIDKLNALKEIENLEPVNHDRDGKIIKLG